MDLSAILQPGNNLAVWAREPDSAIVAEVTILPLDAFPDCRAQVTGETTRSAVMELLRARGLDPLAFPAWLADMADLTRRFRALTGGWPVRLRLESLAADGCRRFHVDRTRLRLLCTYLGPGTEWLDNAQVDRLALETGRPNEAILRHGEPNRLRPFWVGVMKGDQFPGNQGNGLVHRSPPIAGTGETRILFCLDA